MSTAPPCRRTPAVPGPAEGLWAPGGAPGPASESRTRAGIRVAHPGRHPSRWGHSRGTAPRLFRESTLGRSWRWMEGPPGEPGVCGAKALLSKACAPQIPGTADTRHRKPGETLPPLQPPLPPPPHPGLRPVALVPALENSGAPHCSDAPPQTGLRLWPLRTENSPPLAPACAQPPLSWAKHQGLCRPCPCGPVPPLSWAKHRDKGGTGTSRGPPLLERGSSRARPPTRITSAMKRSSAMKRPQSPRLATDC